VLAASISPFFLTAAEIVDAPKLIVGFLTSTAQDGESAIRGRPLVRIFIAINPPPSSLAANCTEGTREESMG